MLTYREEWEEVQVQEPNNSKNNQAQSEFLRKKWMRSTDWLNLDFQRTKPPKLTLLAIKMKSLPPTTCSRLEWKMKKSNWLPFSSRPQLSNRCSSRLKTWRRRSQNRSQRKGYQSPNRKDSRRNPSQLARNQSQRKLSNNNHHQRHKAIRSQRTRRTTTMKRDLVFCEFEFKNIKKKIVWKIKLINNSSRHLIKIASRLSLQKLCWFARFLPLPAPSPLCSSSLRFESTSAPGEACCIASTSD